MKLLWAILFFLIPFSIVFAQNKSIVSGKVLDGKNAEPLIGAVIKIKGTSIGTTTDFNGTFSINGLEEGNYTIECSYISYQQKTITDVIVKH